MTEAEVLAQALNAFEEIVDESVVVESNLATHHADCGHVAVVLANLHKAGYMIGPSQLTDSGTVIGN